MSREAGKNIEGEKVWQSGVIADIHKVRGGIQIAVTYLSKTLRIPQGQRKLALLSPMGAKAEQSLQFLVQQAKLRQGMVVEWIDDSSGSSMVTADPDEPDLLAIADFRIAQSPKTS